MKANDLLDMIGNVDDAIIEEAKKRKKPVMARWTRWVAVAACVALVVAVGIPYISDVIGKKAGPGQNDPFRPTGTIEFNGAYYEIVKTSNTDKLNDYNLPREITADMIGNKLGSGLDADGKQTKEFFYQYTPYAEVSITAANGDKRAQRAVFVVSDDNEYSFALFSGFINYGDGTNYEAKEMFAVYGVDKAADISVVEADYDSPDAFRTFIDGLFSAFPSSNENYQSEVDGAVDIKIVTKDGLVIHGIQWVPETSNIYWGQSVYKLP